MADARSGTTDTLIRARSAAAIRWNAGQSCQRSPSSIGVPSMIHEPTSRWRRGVYTMPVISKSRAMVSSRRLGIAS